MTETPTVETKNSYPETIFKSSYSYREMWVTLFVNFRKISESFSFIIKKGKFPTVFNLTKEDKIPFVKAVVSQLTPAEFMEIQNFYEQKKA